MLLKNLLPNISSKFENIEVVDLTCDSRKVKNGYAFICINGFNADGHRYALQAEEAGAAVIIAEKPTGAKNEVIVEDTHLAYAVMSANYFGNPSKHFKLIGVTGTNGKTSITYMLKAIIESKGFKTGVIGTIQNIIGDRCVEASNTTPDAYGLNALFAEMRDAGCDYVIMEASSHALDQKRIYGLDFEVAAFTNLTQDHLDYHKTMENYFMAKQKLFTMCKAAVINIDDEYGKRLAETVNCECLTYAAEDRNSTYSANGINMKPDGIEYEMVGDYTIKRMRLKTGGKFSVYNSLCAAVCAKKLGFTTDEIAAALAQMDGVKGRAEVVPTGKDYTIIIDYAHTPDGLENILSTFKELKKGRLVCLFGCGGDRDAKKRPIMGAIAAKLSDFVIVTSDNPRSEEPSAIISDILSGMKESKTSYKVIENRVDAIKYAVQNARKDDIIVLAGKGHETYQILSTGKIHLDEREVIAEALAE
ncbi:MAG: UDP-N-acetylmuramoyl-L-alanyl-D-glutamate--2,6-diaminopimelate ligase [Acutalibacteraceae bacterium]|nr:UDP-N-acetylmuramoyl-L-alanyl-D-glutamate--2,6-diaminopimelate ligase [Acutalibacteraceae bacterium]